MIRDGATRAVADGRSVQAGEPIEHAVLGAGPAGLTAAYVLALRGRSGAVIEAGDQVGGIARTVVHNGYRFDLGGHRFFTKLAPILRLWESILGEDFLTRPRLSRIYFHGDYMTYPLEAREVLSHLGLIESGRCMASYVASCCRRTGDPETFEDWVTSRFGKRLYAAFFESYTEKVWGIPGSEVRSQWASQRIKNFSFKMAVLDMLRLNHQAATTLIEEFRYPRLGPGQMWEAFQDRVEGSGIPVMLNRRCVALHHDGSTVHTIVTSSSPPAQNGNGRAPDHDERAIVGARSHVLNGNGHPPGGYRANEAGYQHATSLVTTHQVDSVLSSIPLRELILSLRPHAPEHVLAAARRLRYRSLCVVALITSEREPFPDNWIYLHDPGVRAGRVQNFRAWSEGLVVGDTTCLGAEYFCFEGDELWRMPDQDAVALARDELAGIGLIDPAKVLGGTKVRVPKAYPMYDRAYEESVKIIREYLDRFKNLKTFGRNGLHRYNNQDHSMWTAILATLNQIDGSDHDVWSVNTEAEYHEAGELIDGMLRFELAPA